MVENKQIAIFLHCGRKHIRWLRMIVEHDLITEIREIEAKDVPELETYIPPIQAWQFDQFLQGEGQISAFLAPNAVSRRPGMPDRVIGPDHLDSTMVLPGPSVSSRGSHTSVARAMRQLHRLASH